MQKRSRRWLQLLSRTPAQPVWRCALSIASTLTATSAWADETNAPPQLSPEEMFEGGASTNWVEFSVGGYLRSGNKGQAQQRQQTSGGAFGGIEDFHYQANVATNTVLAIDGRGIFDNHDYKLRLDLAREKVGYLRFSYNEFRTWYNGNGGFDPSSHSWYPGSRDALPLDRGDVSIEGGLTLEDKPAFKFKYSHTTRDGEKNSTSWGITHPNGGAARGLSPSFYDIKERGDTFQLDVTHTIDKTDIGLGLRYDTGKLDNALKITQSPGEAFQRNITDRQGTTYDMFNVHAFTETWLTNNLMFATAFSYSDLDTDFSGSRVYGSDFDVSYVPNALNGFGYYGLAGGSRLHEYISDFNLLYKPTPNLTIIPSLRVQKEDTESISSGTETLSNFAVTDFTGRGTHEVLDVRERLDLRYTGFTNWVLYARTDFTEGDGNLYQSGGLVPINGIGVRPIERKTDDGRFFQKYSAGARWYPARQLTLDVGGYYKLNKYDYDHRLDSTANDSFDRYPAYLAFQDFETYDGNSRISFRPLPNVTLSTRYEFQLSHIRTTPDSASGLNEVQSSRMTSHIIAEDIGWSPWSRLHLQAGVNYILSDTRTPASEVTEAILRSQNNYWTLQFSSNFVVDNKTDIKLNYFYYRADNPIDTSGLSVPYAANSEEHGIAATLVRRLSSNIRWTLRYGFFREREQLSGGNQDFDAHLLFSTIQYRF